MRFSSLFQKPVPPREPRAEDAASEQAMPAGQPAAELPEDLDARVRLVGEWQVSEY